MIRPLDYSSTESVWVVRNASKTGVGSMYGQGPTWDLCRPAGFMSKKFTNAQQHYAIHEQETLAILNALQKWEDKLVGHRFHVITDHKALEFFQAQAQLSNRQRRWMEYMSHFDFDITYVKANITKWRIAYLGTSRATPGQMNMTSTSTCKLTEGWTQKERTSPHSAFRISKSDAWRSTPCTRWLHARAENFRKQWRHKRRKQT